MKTLDVGISEEQLIRGLAELAAKKIMAVQAGHPNCKDPDDASRGGGAIFKEYLFSLYGTKTFAKIVKNIFPGYNEELFLDGVEEGVTGL